MRKPQRKDIRFQIKSYITCLTVLALLFPCVPLAQQVQQPGIATPDGVVQELKKAETEKSTFPQPSWLQPYNSM